jgi:hypothetical protein
MDKLRTYINCEYIDNVKTIFYYNKLTEFVKLKNKELHKLQLNTIETEYTTKQILNLLNIDMLYINIIIEYDKCNHKLYINNEIYFYLIKVYKYLQP